MTDLIKRAVEVADGWEIYTVHGDCSCPDGLHRRISDFHQMDLDALAAQLVRQVDAMGGKFLLIISSPNECHIGDEVLAAVANSQGPDRTMTTIEACVAFYEGRVAFYEGRDDA